MSDNPFTPNSLKWKLWGAQKVAEKECTEFTDLARQKKWQAQLLFEARNAIADDEPRHDRSAGATT